MKRRDEDDFAGFVRGQSGALFRTAYLLTGDYQRAEDLLLDTLARVYQRWSRISSTTQPDGYALSLLVSRATPRRRRRSPPELPPLSAAEVEDPEHAERVAASCTVWNTVLSLPPRQRAVVVLRYYDHLSEADTAETLGLAPGTVRGLAQAAGRAARGPAGRHGIARSAEEPVMRVDELLRTSAADVASTVAPPGVDPARVRARVRARRAATRRRLLGGVLLAAAVATALLVVLGPGRRPAAAPPPRPVAPRDAAVWADARGIHVGARTFRPAVRPVSLTMVADGLVYTDRDGRVWLQGLDGSSPARIGRAGLGTAPLGAADGTTVAWILSTSGRNYLVMYDTRKRTELARSLVVGGLGDGTLTGGTHVDSPGPFFYVDPERVVYHANLGTFAFDRGTGRFTRLAGEQPRPDAETLPGDLLVTVDAVPGLRAVAICCAEDPRLQRPAAFVDDAGKVLTRIGRVEASGLFDHDWRRYAAVVDTSRHGQRVEVVDVDSGRARAITPKTTFFSLLAWGYGDVLMVYEFDVDVAGETGPPRLLRCDVSAWSCASVDLPPGRVVLPTS